MLIGVDLCNTLANINGLLEDQFQIKPETYPALGVPRDFFTSPEGLAMLYDARPFPYAARVLDNIKKAGCEIVYITSRPSVAEFVTEQWLKKNNFPPPDGMAFLPREKKAEFVQRAGITCFFEDDPLVLSTLLKSNLKYIFAKEWPYNSGLVDKKVIKFYSWRELLDWPFTKGDIEVLLGQNCNYNHHATNLYHAKGGVLS